MWSRWWATAGAVAAAGLATVFLSAPGVPTAPTASAHGGKPAAGTHAGTAHRQETPAQQPRQALSGPVVALGDSYTAGDMMPLSLTSQPLGCLRSSDAYAAQVARALGASARFVDVACSGAGIQEMTSAQQTYLGTNPPQLSALAPDDSVVMLTLGGDDLGFLNVLHACMELSITDLNGSPCESRYASGGTDQLAAEIAAEAPKMTRVLQHIRALAPEARVILVGYPDLFPQQGGCWPVVPITDGDIAYLRGTEMQLNAMLAQAAAATGATFVDTYDPTVGHDFCQGAGAEDVEGLVPTSLAAPFHMNARGQAAVAGLVLAALGHGQAAG